MSSEKVYLSSIRVKDFRGIANFAAELGQICIVAAANGEGKTSLLESISSVLEGGTDVESIRIGTDQAEIELTLSDGTLARKVIRPNDYELKVLNPDGSPKKAPGTWIKDLCPGVSWNPLAFLESDPRDRAKFLLDTLPLTFTAAEVNEALGVPTVSGTVTLQRLGELRQGKYDERTNLNREARNVEGMVAEMKASLGPEDGKDWGSERDRLAAEVAGIDGQISSIAAEIELEAEQSRNSKRVEVEEKISRLRAELADYVEMVNRIAAEALAEQTAAFKRQQSELSLQLGEARAKADRQQQGAGVKKAIAERTEALRGFTLKEIRLSNALKAIDELKHRRLKELPIQGLDLKSDSKGRPVILIDGVPLDKLNRQQQLFVAIQAVNLAAGRMPLIVLEAAELDMAHLIELAEATSEAGIQMVMARWLDGEPLTVMSLDQYRERMQVTA